MPKQTPDRAAPLLTDSAVTLNATEGAEVDGRPGRTTPTISVVIPTLNEAANLPHVLTRIPASVDEVVLVDGRSIDDTIVVARALRPDIRVVLQDGRGKGNALACGFAAAHGSIIVMLDADGSTDPAEIDAFVAPLLAGHDFAKGSRFLGAGGSEDITGVRRAGNRVLLALLNVLYGTRYTDLCYGYNAFWRSCLPHMSVNCDGFEVETLITARVARAGLSVVEVPSVEHERLHGVSNLNALPDGMRVLRTILRERIRRVGGPRWERNSWQPTFREFPAPASSEDRSDGALGRVSAA
ncbi:MAG TPA: glycosyltransferase family 2 protein [Solirubrobacteraceae bacterium]|nr:glycosyltransferase family 2 protein [Solirubrobacteraceae bacterium]